MYQKIIIAGNLGNDPEQRFTGDGTPVTNISVATNRKWTNQDGSQGEETVWFRCTAWRKQAEIINQYLSKGSAVLIEGRLNPDRETGGPRTYTRSDGTPGAQYEVTIETIKFLGGRGGEGGDSSLSSQTPPPPGPHEDEIPF